MKKRANKKSAQRSLCFVSTMPTKNIITQSDKNSKRQKRAKQAKREKTTLIFQIRS